MQGICCGDIVGGGCLLLSLFKQKVLAGWLSVSFILGMKENKKKNQIFSPKLLRGLILQL